MFDYFYNEIMRKTIIGFGTLFNDIVIKKTNESGETFSEIKVPLAYGPKQKFLARLEESPELNRPFQMTLPRMSFEFVNLTYDPARKASATQTFLAGQSATPSNIVKTYLPVPYNMDFELSIMTKLNDDMLQIVEQILPYFQPSYNISINLVDTIGEKRDIPIVFNNIVMEDNYDGDFNSRRYLIYTLSFTAKTYLFGPTSTVNKDIIKKISINYNSGDSNSTTRDYTYSIEPTATKNYTNNVVATLSEDIDSTSDSILVSDAQSISVGSYITINNETLKVTSKNQNVLFVQRGSYSTRSADHVSGTDIKLITQQDDALIQFGDDFGFK
jgi:hypothetical protein